MKSLLKRNQNDFYDWRPLLKKYPGYEYYIALSERRNGKTYSAIDLAIEAFAKTGKMTIIIRRFAEDFTGVEGDRMVTGPSQNGLVSQYTNGEWEGVYHSGTRFYFFRNKETVKKNGERAVHKEIMPQPFAMGAGLNSMEHSKGSTMNGTNIAYIFFDEFITKNFYLTDEFTLFQNVLATFLSGTSGVPILMAGNTMSKIACPYFREMGLYNVKNQEQGTVETYQYGQDGARVAVEYCKPRIKSKASNRYFAFGNPKLKMITSGEWEVAPHPHLDRGYKPKDVKFKFYVDFDGELNECSIVQRSGEGMFMFVSNKTTPLKYPGKDLIYSDRYDPRINWRRSIYKDSLEVSSRIRNFISDGRVYFSDNQTGEVWDAYLNWAKVNT